MHTRSLRGFTLIEMLVSVALFVVVMVVALGALLAMSQSDRKAESLKVVINNLNSALDSMSRTMRTGRNYHCGTSGTLTQGAECPTTGGTYVVLLESDNLTYAIYCYDSVAQQLKRYVTQNSANLSTHLDCTISDFIPLTSPEMKITSLNFYVAGLPAPQGGTTQPRIVLLMQGYVTLTAKQKTQLQLQTTVTQRLYNQ